MVESKTESVNELPIQKEEDKDEAKILQQSDENNHTLDQPEASCLFDVPKGTKCNIIKYRCSNTKANLSFTKIT